MIDDSSILYKKLWLKLLRKTINKPIKERIDMPEGIITLNEESLYRS